MSRLRWVGRALTCASLTVGIATSGCPAGDTLVVTGKLEREGVRETNLQNVVMNYGSKSARGEWWSCDLRLTATACIGDDHVNAWVALPTIQDFGGLGDNLCVDDESGNAYGAYELLTEKLTNGDEILVPDDVSVLFLVSSDADDDGQVNLDVDEETTAASRLAEGTIEVLNMGTFESPLSIRITGKTTADNEVELQMSGPTSAVPNAPPLDKASSCVADDALEQ